MGCPAATISSYHVCVFLSSIPHVEIQSFSTFFKVRLDNITVNGREDLDTQSIIDSWRGRSADISWFMGGLNEFIARKANKEDECSGRFYSLPSMALTLQAS